MKVRFAAFVVFLAVASSLMADGPTSSGTLNISGSVDPTISLTFVSDESGATLTGDGTATATVPFGTVKAYGYTPAGGITQHINASGASATQFDVSTPFGVLVMKANTASANYTLTATLSSADASNTWNIDSVNVSDGTVKTITATGSYDTAVSHTVKITVPFTNTNLSLANSISFTATAN